MKVLLTGAAGFIGSHLVERMIREGDEVVGLDAFDGYLYEAAPKRRNAEALSGLEGFRMVEGNLLDADLLTELCAEVDVVVHLAALAGVRPSIEDPPRYVRTNLEGTTNVLEACRKGACRRLVFASSSSVYGAKDPTAVPFREDDPCLRPASPYAATKRAGELLCSTYRDLFGLGTLSLRFFTVYGPRQRPDMAIHKFARRIRDGEPLTLFGDGTSARDYTFIDDIIDGTYASCLSVQPGDDRVYNLGGSQTTRLLKLVEIISENVGAKAQIQWEPDQPGDVPITCADVSRAHADLGYDPKVPVAEGIPRFVAWLREQP